MPASTCASTGGLGHVALRQATSCFEADAYHGSLVRACHELRAFPLSVMLNTRLVAGMLAR